MAMPASKRRRRVRRFKPNVINKKLDLDTELFNKKPARLLNKTGRVTELPAGRPFNEPKKLRQLQHESNEQLSSMICDINGQMPTFGYPLISYSPKEGDVGLTDAELRKHAIISDGGTIRSLNQDQVVMKSTAQLKVELTEKMEKQAA